MLHIVAWSVGTVTQERNAISALSLSILKLSWQKIELTIVLCINCNHGICHVKVRLVDLIGSPGIENATSA